MANKYAGVVQSGVNNYLSPALAFNGVATDTIIPGVAGSFTNTSGVAPATGSFAANAQGSPNMTVAISAGSGYVLATPTSGTAQVVRVTSDGLENVTIAANSTGSTRYDFIYIKVDADKLNNPATTGLDVVTYVVQRSTTQTVDSNGALANGVLIAEVTVANGASSIANASIQDRRLPINSQTDGWQQANETWTYASATTITVPSGATFKYAVGDKIRFIQSGSTKFMYITGVANTLLTVTGGTDYTLANAAIGSPCFSKRVSPVGFPQTFAYAGPLTTNISVNKGSTGSESYTFTMNGKRVSVKGYLVAGGTGIDFGSGGSTFTIPLPVTISAGSAAQHRGVMPLGIWQADDSGSSSWNGTITYNNTTTVGGYSPNGSGDVRIVAWTNSKPISPAAGDSYSWSFEYDI